MNWRNNEMKKRLIALGLIAGVAVMMAGCSTTPTDDVDATPSPAIVDPSEPVVETNDPSNEPVVESADPDAENQDNDDVNANANADVEADTEADLQEAE